MKNSTDGLTLKPNRLAQMLRQNGGCKVVVAAPQGIKMDLARKLGAGDVGFQNIYISTHNGPNNNRNTSNFPVQTQKFSSRRSRMKTHTASSRYP
jgi:hypothetical protein